MKKIALPAMMISLSLLTGCATIVNGETQQMSLQTQPPGASCTLSNNKGKWQVNSPAPVEVHRSMDDLQVVCQKPGYKIASTSVASSMKKMMLGNFIFGGIIGVVVDSVDGAGFSYPGLIKLNLQAESISPPKKALSAKKNTNK